MENSIKVKLVEERQIWEGFWRNLKRLSFPQSWSWGEFQKSLGNNVWRVGVFDGEQLVGLAQLIQQQAKRGNFIIVPHGPFFLPGRRDLLSGLVDYMVDLAKRNKAWFLRVAPFWLDSQENRQKFFSLGFHRAPMFVHAERTWNLNLKPSEEELLAQMRKTTRWSIRKAKKLGVKVEISANSEDIKIYKQLEKETAKRKHFTPYSFRFEEKLFETFAPNDQVAIFKGIWQGRVLAAAVVIFWQRCAFYYLGASLTSKVPVSYLVQWEAIREAKRRGCRTYNFWGIAPNDNRSHPWWGITMFKKGFAGFEERLLPTMDLKLNPKYYLTWLIETVRRRKRRL
jgi:lipid II:glycine glycyltransferase (peptidoglycan interpeptide bridge formation enzyme)